MTVYERRAWGGKTRSTGVPRSATGGRRPLPGEHAWRIFAVNKPGKPSVLKDDLIVSSDIDTGLIRRRGRLISEDPLVLPTVGQRPDRPAVTTVIPDLMLAGDYLKSDLEVANMETASYKGRRAANAVLARSGSSQTPAAAIKPYRPPEWEPVKRIDAERYKRGQPNLFEIG